MRALTKTSVRLRISICILGGLMFLAGCAGASPPVYQDPSLVVRIEPNPGASGQLPMGGNAQALTVDRLGGVLRGAYVHKKQGLFGYLIGGAQTQPVFPEENMPVLASELLKGLRRAKPDEQVTFQVWRTGKKGLRDETSGAMYLRGNLLYISVDKFRVSQQMSYEGAEGGSGKDVDLLFEPAAAVVERQKGFASKWLGGDTPQVIIDLQQLIASAPAVSELPMSKPQDSPASATPTASTGRAADVQGRTVESLQRRIDELTSANQTLLKTGATSQEEVERLRLELAKTKQALADKVLELNRIKSRSQRKTSPSR